MSFVENIQRRIYAKTSMFGAWLPTDRLNVGEYGLIRRGRFNREGQLRQRGIAFTETRTATVPSKLGFSDRAKFVTKNSANAELAAKQVSGALELSLSGEGAFVYQLEDIVARRIADKESFFQTLFSAILSGKLKWQDEFVLIDEVREAGAATMIVLESDSGKLVLKGKLPVGAESSVPLARLSAQTSVDVESGSIFQALGQTSSTPLYHVVRLSFDPAPSGPGKALSEMWDWIQEQIGINAGKPYAIHMSDYLSSDGMFSFRASVDSKLSFTIKAETVSLEEFLDLGAHDDEKEFALPIEEVREVRYARAG